MKRSNIAGDRKRAIGGGSESRYNLYKLVTSCNCNEVPVRMLEIAKMFR